MNYRSLLLPFYFGSVNDQERLLIERELLLDSEILVDYFDLKRKIEAAQEIPQLPSPRVWQRLSLQIKPRKGLILSVGLGLAASFIIMAMIFLKTKPLEVIPSEAQGEILFDTRGELPANFNVL